MHGQPKPQPKQQIEENYDYDLRQRFIDAGIEPLWPTHPAWDEFNDVCSILQTGGLDFKAIDTHDLLEMCRNERGDKWSSKIRYGYGLASTPIIETYIRWCTKHKEGLNATLLDRDNTVHLHPIVIDVLRTYILSLNSDQTNETHQAVELLSKAAPLGPAIETKIVTNIQNRLFTEDLSQLREIVNITPYLDTPVKIPISITDQFVKLMHTQWPYEVSDNQTITPQTEWFTKLPRLEPIIASWLESDLTEDILIGALYNYLPRVDWSNNDIYTTWLYVALEEFLHKPLVRQSDQYQSIQDLVTQATNKIPLATQEHWREQLQYLNGLYDNALAKATTLLEPPPIIAHYPLDIM